MSNANGSLDGGGLQEDSEVNFCIKREVKMGVRTRMRRLMPGGGSCDVDSVTVVKSGGGNAGTEKIQVGSVRRHCSLRFRD